MEQRKGAERLWLIAMLGEGCGIRKTPIGGRIKDNLDVVSTKIINITVFNYYRE